ncbi:hypothetical protein A2U01_0044127 [Trifolium medium]|uniref:Uncharacterized protein n=1 Tax=Trifolium medium TaxID=97028 RepID=A0A392QG84_9FABA|nr:hypothetical protein [Trifolium medium]
MGRKSEALKPEAHVLLPEAKFMAPGAKLSRDRAWGEIWRLGRNLVPEASFIV